MRYSQKIGQAQFCAYRRCVDAKERMFLLCTPFTESWRESELGLFYRASAFGVAHGPWRGSKRKAEQDALAAELGSYDEWGKFYLSAGAEIEWIHENELRKSAAARPSLSRKIPARGSSGAHSPA